MFCVGRETLTDLRFQSNDFLLLILQFFLLEIQLALIFFQQLFGFLGQVPQLGRCTFLIIQLLIELGYRERLLVQSILELLDLFVRLMFLCDDILPFMVQLEEILMPVVLKRGRVYLS